jgi:predicted PurR-regulated permease PerM
MGIVAGELVWGIPGMILSIPLLGIAKIICDGVPLLQPIGFLIGTKPEKKPTSFFKNLKKRFSR